MTLPHNHDYIERCPHCSRFMTAAQAKNHVCDSPLIDVKEIEILFHYDTQKEYGDTIVMARG